MIFFIKNTQLCFTYKKLTKSIKLLHVKNYKKIIKRKGFPTMKDFAIFTKV